MSKGIVIISVEDDSGHAKLIEKNLKKSEVVENIIHFENGEEVLNFLMRKGDKPHREKNIHYVLLLDIRMPKIDGLEVLRQVKMDEELRKMPVIMLTTTDDPNEIELCYKLGCNNYITKPVDYDKFSDILKSLDSFIKIVKLPSINGDDIEYRYFEN
ncbi:MAG: response regulator [Bacteroidales bacterium]|nr:response regulator [Bacteroidales bacterium]